jgi:cation-transporting P-type ATPase I
MLAGLRTLTALVAAPVSAAIRTVTPTDRQAWSANGRAHVEVRGAHLPGRAQASERIKRRLARCEGVRWAEVNAALGCVVLDHDPARTSLSLLVDEVRAAEVDAGVADEPFADVTHPGDRLRTLSGAVVLGTHLACLGYATTARLLPVPALPQSFPAALATADSSSHLRSALESRMGGVATDLLFGISRAVAGALAQSPSSLITDAGHWFCVVRESQAVQGSWQRWDGRFGRHRASHRCAPLAAGSRPVDLPAGPVERETGVSVVAGPGAFAGMLGLNRDPGRAQGFLVAGVPRAALIGRDVFAAQLGYGLSERDALVLDPGALRRLDRVNTVVVDASLLHTGKSVVHEVIRPDGRSGSASMWERAYDLVGADGPRERGGWRLTPVPSGTRVPRTLRGAAARDSRILALQQRTRTVALVEVENEPDPLAEELLNAARAVGSVLLAGRSARGNGLAWVPLKSLVGSIRELQREGACVAVVSARHRDALAAADVGLGVARGDGPPWGADLITGPSLGECCVLLRTIPLAHTVSRRSAQISVAGSAVAAVLAGLGPSASSQDRASVPVSTASGFALGAGVWWGLRAASTPVPRAVARTPWHSMTSDRALALLNSSPEGLSESEAQDRAAGPDRQAPGGMSLARAALEELATPLTPALATGAAISAGIGAVADAVLIGGVLAVNALIGGVQRFNADRTLQHLLQVSEIPVGLRRRGQRFSAPADDLVVGDVVELVAGDAVPADCRLLEAEGVEVDESSLTGESQLVAKSTDAAPAAAVADRHCMVYQGTAIAAGRALAVVVATGQDTEAGSAMPVDVGTRAGGVAARLRSLAKVMVPLSLGSGVLLLVSDLARGHPLRVALSRAVGMAVAAVPEGLPFVATVAELAAARRLSQRGAVVRDSSTIEALGRADVLCFDKTGTLTEGRIALRRVSDGITSQDLPALSAVHRRVLAAALRASPLVAGGQPLPHPTDQAVVDGARQARVRPTEDRAGWRPVDEMPFEPSRGYHAVLGSSREGNLLSVKGAPEIVLAQCTHWRRDGGDEVFDEAIRARVQQEFERLARQGYRVLAVAERPASDRSDLDESRVQRLRLIGLLALADPVRPAATAAVAQLQQARVQIVMITGDHPSTAESIAAELGALNAREVMTGAELDGLDDDELAARIGNVGVFARVTPTQKARIVEALQRIGRVVAVTGDGANDAPAIRLADVGIALGDRATPAAREAADVVVLDNRIETIVDAIVEGRAMWASVRDALALLLGGNLGEIGCTIGTGLLSPTGSLNARQLLLINLLTDVLPAMAIAVRPPPEITPEMLLAEGPEASLGSALIRDITRRGVITASAATGAWVLGRATGTVRHANTVALVALVGGQLGQTLAVRGRTPLVVVSSLAALAALAAIVQTPGVSQFFGSTPLWPHGWLIAGGASAIATAVSMLL